MSERHPFIKKGSSEGEAMAARREFAREWLGDHRVQDIILGDDAISLDRQRRAPMIIDSPLVDTDLMRKSVESRWRHALDVVRRHLCLASDRMREDVMSMFRHYFESQPDVEAAAHRIGLEYADDEEMEKEIDRMLRWFQKVNPASPVSKEKIRRHLIALEIADVLTQRFEHGPIDETDDIISDDVLLEILRDRKAWVETRKQAILKRLESVRPRVHERLLDAARDGTLPMDSGVMKERIDLLIVDVLDPLAYRFDDVYGEFNMKHHAVHLSATVPYESEFAEGILDHVYTHEVLHAVSGQQELLIWMGEPDDEEDETGEEEEFDRVGVQTRVGLRLSSGLRQEQLLWGDLRPHHLHWLNEAVTERLTQRISDGSEPDSYKLQRELLQRLIDAGLPENVVVKAYFENDASKKPGHRMPAMKELFEQTNTLFGRGFLLGLDGLVRDGITKSKKRGARSNDEAISELIRAWDKNRASLIARAVKRGGRLSQPSVG